MEITEIKTKRKKIENEIQNTYNNLQTYREKFTFVYEILMTSRSQYLAWTKNPNFGDGTLEKLLSKINEDTMNNDDFIDFIIDELVKKMESGHVWVAPLEWDEVATTNKNSIPEEQFEPFKNRNVEIAFNYTTAIISIHSFSHQRIDKDAYIFENLNEYLKNNDINNIIIDIRGNGGGSDSYFKLFSCFTEKDFSCDWHFWDLFVGQDLSYHCNFVPTSNCNKPYNRYLLVDDKVFSSSEAFAKYCQKTGYATIIGSPTMGEGDGFTPFKLILSDDVYAGKEAKVLLENYGRIGRKSYLNFPTDAPINSNGEIDYEHCYATKPDIECPPDKALEVALSMCAKPKQNEISGIKK